MSDEPKYPFVETRHVPPPPPPPKPGDRRRRREAYVKGKTWVRQNDDGSKYEFVFTRAAYVDITEEYMAANLDAGRYRAEWVSVGAHLETITPYPTMWERFSRWFGLSPRIPTAKMVNK